MPDTFERLVQDRFPWIEWRIPLKVTLMETQESFFGCRFCIARLGLKGSEVRKLAKTEEECQRHIDEVHREN